ncbi:MULTISPECIES: hypothetical protein [Microbacterium]|uniref:hypothetical protein n=1 Tax=Microbacterium TaxID=33882 RepID=UPI00217D1950|nr:MULTISPECIES: hypothetical protein [Microbacterium]UWF77026.1 hypothetical protein JSY13_09445 [Microbacterium neungamense]WCM55186.1 hypothetical protein JRG78_09455 [Microbacterium sp. EF45047]
MPESRRQRIERVPGARRARLTPAPGTDPDPESRPGSEAVSDAAPDPAAPDAAPPRVARSRTGAAPASGPNDERMLREVPPHY